MKLNNILVTGDRNMINRHKYLFKVMSDNISQIEYLKNDSFTASKKLKNLAKLVYKAIPFLPVIKATNFRKNDKIFINQSRKIEQKISKLPKTPDLIFHIYGMFSPFWESFNIPYVIYLDYTMVKARKNWLPWAPFKTEKDFFSWVECEKKTYNNADHIFTKSNCIKLSLINDYGVPANNITVVYSSGQFSEIYQEKKSFGTKQILFNGSDFQRKGGDLLLKAFQQVKKAIPEAKLAIVGQNLTIKNEGVDNLGYISFREEMERIFLNSDLVVSPARCEPLGLFLIEAMNYGIPCIVSNQDGMPEIIENQVNGIVLENLNTDVLASHIIQLLSRPEVLQNMSEEARKKIKTQLNWSVIAEKITNVLNKI